MTRLFWVYLFGSFAYQPVNVIAQTTELHHNQAVKLVSTGQIMSLSDTLAIVNQYCRGTLMDAHLYQDGNQWRYDLELKITESQLLQLSVNASTALPEPNRPLPNDCPHHETTAR